ncbi:hypothetical protein HMN09_00646300 [Mycena chlorophos]|uniref:Uncharacterized protein n=1 Tax=Mycena chlorophos TaxID=658473 RepID=A0A8H6T560_MYCCL|nr:hypothetical protein HMN09_00646300 [Mycena chlorophos]
MSPLPSRKALQEMPRHELQKLCKDHDIKANLKTESLIELLLDKKSGKQKAPSPPPPPTRRSVSTRTRNSSMIVHDEPEEEEEQETENQPESEPVEPQPMPTRARKKAKETQTRLGVGRPVAVGGSGPRTVTKSVSVAKSKRGRNSKAVKPVEETIPEEVEEEHPERSSTQDTPVPAAGPSKQAYDATELNALINSAVEQAVRPLTQQLKTLESEMTQLRKQVVDAAASNLAQAATIAVLEGDLKKIKEDNNLVALNSRLVGPPTTPRLYSPVARPNSVAKLRAPPSVQNSELPNPGIAPTLLGKRSRESTSSNITGIIEEGEQDGLTEEELANAVLRPTKKRARLDADDGPADEESGPAFAVYSGEEEEPYVDPPPPTQRLPEFYGPASPAASTSSRQATSSQNAAENQPPFTFAFLPISSTPADAAFNMPNFPYPQAPTSPSPAGASSGIRNQSERTDMFQSLGLPNPAQTRARVTSTSLTRATSRPEDAPSFGTMYGTELDGDARFGDFGVEGVAGGGFWPAAGRF